MKILKKQNKIQILSTLTFLCWLAVLIPKAAFSLTIGVTAGPHAIIMEEVKKEYLKKGYSLKIVEFSDFILPNAALDQGDIDLNSSQHQPFLDEQVKSRHYKIASIAKTILLPLGMYSSKHKASDPIPDRAKISIPNDPTNEGRALRLLEKQGLLTLKKISNPSILDIQQNPKKLKIISVEAPQLPRTLVDVDYSIINTDWVLLAGLDPNQALYTESTDSPYANIIAAKIGTESRADIQAFVQAYQSEVIRKWILKHFKGAILPAWSEPAKTRH